jgi:hypothetical protein
MISKQILARNRDDVALEAVQRHVEVHWKPARGHGGLRPCLALYRRVNQCSGAPIVSTRVRSLDEHLRACIGGEERQQLREEKRL